MEKVSEMKLKHKFHVHELGFFRNVSPPNTWDCSINSKALELFGPYQPQARSERKKKKQRGHQSVLVHFHFLVTQPKTKTWNYLFMLYLFLIQPKIWYRRSLDAQLIIILAFGKIISSHTPLISWSYDN
ncbi:hypothetical protein ACSBR1_014754 [Camellia fascicularis]